jgi:hypothetical protein
VGTVFLSDIRPLNAEIVLIESVPRVEVRDKGVVVILPLLSIVPIKLINYLKAGLVTAGIDGGTAEGKTNQKRKHVKTTSLGFNIQWEWRLFSSAPLKFRT